MPKKQLKANKNFRKQIIAVCSVLLLITGIFFPQSAYSITVKEEEELSREFLKVVLDRFQLIKDPLIIDYVNKVSEKIIAVLPPQPFTYHFYIINDEVYNAFAIPAGHIFINRGLLEAMENENELAGILSHEIAHVVCRHISQKIERSKKISIATLAGIAAGIFLGAGGATAVSSALTVGSMAAGQAIELAYSREDEMQADQIGLNYLTQAGYDGEGLLKILKKIRNKQWFGSDEIPNYLTTHPAVEDRIAYIDNWIQGHSHKEICRASIQFDDFERIQTRLIANYGDESVAIKRFNDLVLKFPDNPMVHYGYGLILTRIGNYKDAAVHFKTALGKRAFDSYILQDLGKIYFLEGRYEEAAHTLGSIINTGPYDPERHFFLARSQIELGKLKEAIALFEEITEKSPNYNQAFYFLGEAYTKQGQTHNAHYNLGIFYKNKGELKNAMFHLNKALKNMKDPDKVLEINKMLKEIRQRRFKSKTSP
ncbi:MAG: M48 family metalloprotease [Desulfobacterales bacterium]|nr:M48 family metalloprotease [Desulfobacterales bacterium]